ncbi:MAG: DUF1893 domain-containing protein, partial [Candidatus Bathyarchaeota archaeon]|nr:DUF1893 domain-containing protein [Candidatus Bathyarchaeota archaeon]
MLCVYCKVESVFALTISEGGVKVLEENGIRFAFEERVSHIMNRDKTDVCPFEKRAIDSKTAQEAYVNLKAFAKQLMDMSTKTC